MASDSNLTNVEKPQHGQAGKKEELSKIAPAPKPQKTTESSGTIDSSKSTVQSEGVTPRSTAPSPAPPPQDMATTFFANAFFEIARNNPKLVEANPQLSAIIQTYLNKMNGKQ